MDVSRPAETLLGNGLSTVLRTLAGTNAALTGRSVARLSELSQNGAQKILRTLTDLGLVLAEPAGSAVLYRLNRDHLLTNPLLQILQAQKLLYARLRESLETWEIRPVHVSVFGSVARRTMTPESDIDLLVVRDDVVSFDDPVWRDQLMNFSRDAFGWTGHLLSWLELSQSEVTSAINDREPIVDEWRRDGVLLSGSDLVWTPSSSETIS